MIRCPKCNTLNPDGSHFCHECGTRLRQTGIRCPKCGHLNPVGNLLCDRCNTRLAKLEDVVPPELAKPSSEEPDVTTSPGLKGLSLPTRSDSSKGKRRSTGVTDLLASLSLEDDEPAVVQAAESDEEETPDWLEGLGFEEPAPEELLDASESGPAQDGDLPDWLSGLLDEDAAPDSPIAHEEAEDDLEFVSADSFTPVSERSEPVETAFSSSGRAYPDWLSGISDPALQNLQSPGPAQVPDWLSDLADPKLVAVSASSGQTGLPEWLAALASGPVGEISASDAALHSKEPESEEQLPDWFSDETVTETEPETHVMEVEPVESLPDWMLGAKSPDELLSAPVEVVDLEPEEELPDWFSGLGISESETPSQSAVTQESVAELPDWLSEVAPPAEEVTASPVEAVPEPAEELPDWLSDLGGVEPAAEPEPAAAPGVADELPDWLSEVAPPAEEVTASPAEAVPEPAEELPDWLSDLSGAEPAAEPELAAAPGVADELPDWLSAVAPPAEEVTASPVEAVPEPAEELPDWLSDLGGVEPAAEPEPAAAPGVADELPDWLSAVAPPAEEMTVSPAEAASEPAEGLPDWLSDFSGVIETAESETVTETETAEGLPDWLSGAALTAEAVQAEPDLAPEPSEELPDWLSAEAGVDVGPDVSESRDTEGAVDTALPVWDEEEEEAETETPLGEEEEEVPDWLRSLKPDVAGPSVADTLAPAEVPAWLNQLRPPGTGPLSLDSAGAEPPSPGTASAVDEIEDIEGLVRAEIPEWLSEYRPTGDASAKHRIRGPAEEEGPLEGLAGVLPAAAVVDMPKDFKPVLKQQVTTTIIEQAQLWQHLLELPRSSERVVEKPRQRAGWRETSARLVIFVVLLVVTIAALTGLTASLGFEARIAQSPPVPATISLKDTIDDLQPGDRVIMAVEYGPAESLEMKHISKVLLRHLETQAVDVVIVSTLPEGVGLSYDLTASSTYTGAMEIAYLPGSASGVARFLSITENTSHVDLLLVLSARPERVRWWVEQNAVNASLPVGIGVSSSAGPLVTPYLEATSTQGWLIGFPGVIAYQESQGLTISKNYGYRLNALMLTQWVAIGMLLFGMAYQLVSGKRGVD